VRLSLVTILPELGSEIGAWHDVCGRDEDSRMDQTLGLTGAKEVLMNPRLRLEKPDDLIKIAGEREIYLRPRSFSSSSIRPTTLLGAAQLPGDAERPLWGRNHRLRPHPIAARLVRLTKGQLARYDRALSWIHFIVILTGRRYASYRDSPLPLGPHGSTHWHERNRPQFPFRRI